MAPKQPVVILEPTIISNVDGLLLSVGVTNCSNNAVTIVTLPRYLTVELKDNRGQFVRGQETNTSINMPAADNYLSIPKSGKAADVFLLPITTEMIGTLKFADVPQSNVVRVTYKAADRIMPNLPSRSRRSFYSGPTEPKSTPIQLPNG